MLGYNRFILFVSKFIGSLNMLRSYSFHSESRWLLTFKKSRCSSQSFLGRGRKNILAMKENLVFERHKLFAVYINPTMSSAALNQIQLFRNGRIAFDTELIRSFFVVFQLVVLITFRSCFENYKLVKIFVVNKQKFRLLVVYRNFEAFT